MPGVLKFLSKKSPNRVRSYKDLSHSDVRALSRILNIHALSETSCSSNSNVSYSSNVKGAISSLPDRLRSHAGRVSLALLSRLPPDYRATAQELCPTHLSLRPDLMHSIYSVCADEEKHIAALVQHLDRTPDFLDDEANLDRLAAFAPLGEATLMRRGSNAYKASHRYAGCRRRSKWHRQRDGCFACMLARYGSDTGVLVGARASILVRFAVSKDADQQDLMNHLMLLENWMQLFGDERAVPMRERSGELAYWLLDCLGAAGPRPVAHCGGRTRRDAFVKVVQYAQRRECRLSDDKREAITNWQCNLQSAADVVAELDIVDDTISELPADEVTQPGVIHESTPHKEEHHMERTPTHASKEAPLPVSPPLPELADTSKRSRTPGTIFLDDDRLNGQFRLRRRRTGSGDRFGSSQASDWPAGMRSSNQTDTHLSSTASSWTTASSRYSHLSQEASFEDWDGSSYSTAPLLNHQHRDITSMANSYRACLTGRPFSLPGIDETMASPDYEGIDAFLARMYGDK